MKTKVLFWAAIIIVFSSNTYSQWTMYSPALTTTRNITSITFINSNTGWIAGDSALIYKTTNAGLNWFSQSLTIGAYTFWDVFAVNPDTLWVCGNAGRIYKSVNGGTNWVQQTSPVTEYLYKMFFTSSSTGYIVTHLTKILKTTDGGENWNIQYVSTLGGELNMIYAPSKDTILAGGQGGVVYRTTNGGNNWTFSQPIFSWMTNMHFVNRTTGWACGRSGALMKTTNAGLNWTTLNSGTTEQINTIFFTNSTTGYFAGTQAMIKKTTNGGTNWYPNETLTGSFYFYSLYFQSPLLGWAAGSSGTLMKTTSGGLVFASETGNVIPDKYTLYTNYPNPFNPETNIKIDIPKNSNVTLSIFNILGKEVDIIVSKEISAGTYEYKWDASKFSSGIYFCKLQTNEYTAVKRMTLIK